MSAEVNISGENRLDSSFLNKSAKYIAVVIIGVVAIQTALTVAIRTVVSVSPAELYLRNISSIILLLVLAQFFYIYYFVHIQFSRSKFMKVLQVSCLILALASSVKAMISLFFVLKYLTGEGINFVLFYYFGELLVWAAVAFFAACYFARSLHKRGRHSKLSGHKKEE